ncbi:Type II secretion system (T2SS)-associated protein Gcp1 [Andalucia godoyi]|uniref:Peroxin-7 n=1 Tax=Andalucia godoyi TaxID=505711 RepID=A0A8K0F4I4_ANDGO|nr:Type II secretion system (T2SS)-associated protein Gcp1 [Andalucia godoyi]|eukprot:ANDGO_06354.mRNA.1 Type II secretion system (T2SS)-associated protein Gcp1
MLKTSIPQGAQYLRFSRFHNDCFAVAGFDHESWRHSGSVSIFHVGQDAISNIGGISVESATWEVDWHPSNHELLFTASHNSLLGLWNVSRNQKIFQKRTDGSAVLSVSVSEIDSELLLTSSESGRSFIWRVSPASCELSGQFAEHSRSVVKSRWNVNKGCVFGSASLDGLVKIWDVRQSARSVATLVDSSSSFPLSTLEWITDSDHLLASGSQAGHLFLWDTRNASRPLAYRVCHEGAVSSLCAMTSFPHLLTTTGADGLVRIWSVARSTIDFEFEHGFLAKQGRCLSCDVDPCVRSRTTTDPVVVAGSSDGTVLAARLSEMTRISENDAGKIMKVELPQPRKTIDADAFLWIRRNEPAPAVHSNI